MEQYNPDQTEYVEQRKEDIRLGLGGDCKVSGEGESCMITCPLLETCLVEEYTQMVRCEQSRPSGTGQPVLFGTQAIQAYYESGLVPLNKAHLQEQGKG